MAHFVNIHIKSAPSRSPERSEEAEAGFIPAVAAGFGAAPHSNRKESVEMELSNFETFKIKFRHADTDTKINMYVDAEGLTQTQYKELLRMFPLGDLDKLEAALG